MNQMGSFSDMKTVLMRRLPLIVFVAAMGCALSVWFALQQPKVYQAIAVVQIEDAKIIDTRTGRTDAAQRLQLMEQRMMARDNVIEIIEDYALFAEEESMAQKVGLFRESARITQISSAAEPWMPNNNPTGLTIMVSMGDAQQAADVANELLARIVEAGRSRAAEQTEQTLAFFAGEEARLIRDIEQREAALAEFKSINADSLPTALTSQRSRLVSLRQTELEIERDIVELQTNTRRQRQGVIEAQVAQLEEQQGLVQQRITEVEAAIRAAPEVEQQLNALERELTQLQDQLTVVTTRKVEAETERTLQQQQQTERFEVLETALVPEYPVSRSRKKTAIMGGVASVIAAVGLAMLLEMINPVIRNSTQIERALGVQTIISVPTIHTRRERRLRRILFLGSVVGLFAMIGTLLRLFWERVSPFLPFRAGNRQAARL